MITLNKRKIMTSIKIESTRPCKVPMNARQFDYIARAAIRSDKQRKAVRRHVIDGLSANAAEKEAYNAEVKTVSRDAKRVRAIYDWAMGLKTPAARKV